MRQYLEILLDGGSILAKVKSLRLERRVDQAVDTLTLELADYSLYSEFDFGALPAAPRVEVLTGEEPDELVSQGKFFIEKPDVAEDINSLAIPSLWGRSALAVMLDPFAPKISRTWKLLTSFYDVCRELVAGAGLDAGAILFDIDDYIIPPNLLSVTGQYPLQIISELAGKTNGYVRGTKAGNLWIKRERFHFDALPIAQALIDDDVEDSRTRLEYPEFGNRILIRSSVASATQPIRISIKSPNSCLRGDGRAHMDVEAIVIDAEGKPVANGTMVMWTIDNPALAQFWPIGSETGEKVIISEPQRSGGLFSLSVDYPIGKVVGVYLESDFTKDENLFDAAGSFEGSSIELGAELPFSDSRLVVDYIAKGVAVSMLRTLAMAAEQETEIHAAIGKIRDTVSFCINNQRNVSINLSSDRTEHNLCAAGPYVSQIVAQIQIDGEPGSGAMVNWAAAGGGTIAPPYSAITTALIELEPARALSNFEVGTKLEITSVVGVWLAEAGTGGTNFYTNPQARTGSFEKNKIVLGTDLPSDDAQVIISYRAAGIAKATFTAPAAPGKSTVTATLQDGTATPASDDIEISTVMTCTGAGGGGAGDPTGGKKDCAKGVPTAVGCSATLYPNAINQNIEECICKQESGGSGCPDDREGCENLCKQMYAKYGVDPLSCEQRVTDTERRKTESELGRLIPAQKAKAFKDCAAECKDNQTAECLDPCVAAHKDATVDRCADKCLDHGVMISPASGSIGCSGAKSLTFSVKGGKGPYHWSASVGAIKAGGTLGESAVLTPPLNGGSAVAGNAYRIAKFHQCGGGFNQTHFGTFGCNDQSLGTGFAPSNNAALTAAPGCAASLLATDFPIPNMNHERPECTPTCDGCPNPSIDFGGGAQCDMRSPAMLTAGCNPCAMALGAGGTVTVTDSTGQSASAVVTA